MKAPVVGFEDVEADHDVGCHTPLQWAADGGFANICTLLTDAGADPDDTGENMDNFTPLHLAALNGTADVVQVQPTSSCVLKCECVSCSCAIERTKAYDTLIGASQALITAGAQLELNDRKKTTPLHLACQEGHPKVVEKILECGCDVERVDQDGDTPLHFAASGTDGAGHPEVLEQQGEIEYAWLMQVRVAIICIISLYHILIISCDIISMFASFRYARCC